MTFRVLLALVAVLALFSLGCKDPAGPDTAPKSDVQLTFTPTYDGQALDKDTDYNYGSFPVRFSLFNLYVSDLTLLKGTAEVKLSEVEFLNFTPDNATTTLAKTIVINYPDAVAAGTYTGIRLGFGVKPELNAKEPADFQPGHPLYLEDSYWPGWQSYIFSKIEGAGFPNGSGSPALDLVYHCGGNQCYKTFSFNQDFVVTDNGGQLNLVIDLKKLFTFNGQLFDIEATPSSSHGSSGADLMEQLMGNFGNAVKVD